MFGIFVGITKKSKLFFFYNKTNLHTQNSLRPFRRHTSATLSAGGLVWVSLIIGNILLLLWRRRRRRPRVLRKYAHTHTHTCLTPKQRLIIQMRNLLPFRRVVVVVVRLPPVATVNDDCALCSLRCVGHHVMTRPTTNTTTIHADDEEGGGLNVLYDVWYVW